MWMDVFWSEFIFSNGGIALLVRLSSEELTYRKCLALIWFCCCISFECSSLCVGLFQTTSPLAGKSTPSAQSSMGKLSEVLKK